MLLYCFAFGMWLFVGFFPSFFFVDAKQFWLCLAPKCLNRLLFCQRIFRSFKKQNTDIYMLAKSISKELTACVVVVGIIFAILKINILFSLKVLSNCIIIIVPRFIGRFPVYSDAQIIQHFFLRDTALDAFHFFSLSFPLLLSTARYRRCVNWSDDNKVLIEYTSYWPFWKT